MSETKLNQVTCSYYGPITKAVIEGYDPFAIHHREVIKVPPSGATVTSRHTYTSLTELKQNA